MTHCAELRTSLGVYVLGAIDPAERSRLEAHLESCPSCRDELAGLAGMPALLGRVNEAQLAQVAGPPPELLDSLLARAAERRRGPRARLAALVRPSGGGGRLWWAPAALAACALLVIGGLLGGFVTAWRDGGTPPAARSVPTAPAATAGGERLSATDASSGVRGILVLYRKKWGTKVELHLAGVPRGGDCRWYAVSRDGERDMLGSWHVAYDKGFGVYESSTMFQRDQLVSIRIVTLDGQPILTIPA
ncbi:anti-sigma factor family protein [Actinomadura sp. SCN-SB]|uniref:anti-sigma factor family protein n=1 Tax=Actinomadura sp. SCN-SB TaxID=3373092 RepID=UPI0037527E13